MATCLVTGGAGFIGSHLVDELVRRGQRVRVLDDFSTGKRANLTGTSFELIEGDVRDLDTVRRAMVSVDYVLHQAALPSVPRSIADPATSHAVNATGTLNVLLAAHQAGVRRVVYASSSSVYGDTPELPRHEDMPTRPLSPYAVAKLAGENYCRVFTHVYGLPTVSLRYFNVFGPRQDPTSQYAAVIPRFITAMLDGKPPVVFGDGLQSRDFTYVTNVVQANLRACESGDGIGAVFNVGGGEQHTLLELVAVLNRILGTHHAPVFDAPRPGDVRHSLAAIDRGRVALGFQPEVGFEEGLRRTIEWFLVRCARSSGADRPPGIPWE
jgi:UDP-glucose 4-epimerase